MKNFIKSVFAVLLLLCMIFSVPAVAESPNRILINGTLADIPKDMGSLKVYADRTFVPVRFVLEYFKYDVSWDEQDKIVFGRNEAGNVFVMQVGSPYLTAREGDKKPENILMDVEPFIVPEEGRTYVPIRFLAQAIGYKVGYDDFTGTVTLEK